MQTPFRDRLTYRVNADGTIEIKVVEKPAQK